MIKSEQINELAAALAKAQGQMEGAKKEAENPYFKSKYADLASVVDAIRGPFAEHGLSYVQLPEPCPGEEVAVETVLMHSSGQWIASRIVVPVTKKDPQGYGSALTYARRYGLQAIAGVAAEDDDGNAASRPPTPPVGRVPAREPIPVPGIVAPDQAEAEARRNFPDEPTGEAAQPTFDEAMEQEKAAVVRRIGAGFDTLAMPAGERVAKWEKHCKQGKFMTTEPSLDALNLVLDELLALAAAQKSRKR